MSNLTAIVKVGTTAASRLRNIGCYRAITTNEMIKLSNQLENNFIIIEHVSQAEYDKCKDFISGAVYNNKKVYFFVPDNDELTTGLADEFGLDIYLESKYLYKAINDDLGVDVDIDIKPVQDQTTGDPDFGFGIDSFGFRDESSEGVLDDALSITSANIGQVHLDKEVIILTKFDAGIGLENLSSSDLGVYTEVIPTDTVEIEDKDIQSKQPELEEISKSAEISGESAETNTVDSLNRSETSGIESVDNTDNQKASELIAASNEEVNKLKAQLDELQANKDNIQKRADEAFDRIGELNKIIKAVKDERDTFKDALAQIETAEIIEDPDTQYEFTRLKEKCESLTDRLNNSANINAQELADLKAERDKLAEDIQKLMADKTSTEDELGKLVIQNQTLQRELEEAQDSTALDEKISELEAYTEELKSKINEQNDQIVTLNTKLEELDGIISNLNKRLDAEISVRGYISSMLIKAVSRLQETESLHSEVENLRESLDKTTQDYNRTVLELNDSKAKLIKTQSQVEERIELARNFARDESDALKRENIALQAKMSMLEGQLVAKTTQYDNLIKVAGIDENGASSLAANNETLTAINNTLRGQLADLKMAFDTSEREKNEYRQSVNNLNSKNQQLTSQIRAMSSGISGGISTGVVQSIRYNGRAQVLSFFGTGSYGVTTTAFTTALVLANNNRVVYVDFDMVAAKADAWFKVSPLITSIPDVDPKSIKSSALGLLIDKGFGFFAANADRMMKDYPNTKGGSLKYISGFYARPDVVKLVSADFSGFLGFLGSNFDYIIIDFGRYGVSDVASNIIKVFADISRTAVVISSADKIDIRNIKMNMQRDKFNFDNMAWLVNLSPDTKIDENTKKYISPARYSIMLFEEGFYGHRDNFLVNRRTRDRFRDFLEGKVLERS